MNNEPAQVPFSQEPEPPVDTPTPSQQSNDLAPPADTDAAPQFGSTDPMPDPIEVAQASIEPSTLSTAPVVGSVPDMVAPVKRSKKKLMIGLVAAGVLIVFGGSAAAYNLWYQNPDKVLVDAVINSLKAKSVVYTGEFNFEQKNTVASLSPFSKFKFSVDGEQTPVEGLFNAKIETKYQGKDLSLSGSALYDKDHNIYLKINDLRKTIDAMGASGSLAGSPYDAIITKVDGKWVKIMPKDLDEFSPGYSKNEECTNETAARLQQDNEAISELVKLYEQNKFIVVKEKLGSNNGSLGYSIKGDEARLKSFAKGLNDTKVVKEYQKCDEDFKIDSSLIGSSKFDKKDDSNSRFEIWVDRWSHQFTAFKLSSDDSKAKGSLVINTQFNKPVTVKAPTEGVITLSQLRQDIEAAMMSQYTGVQERARAAAARSRSISQT